MKHPRQLEGERKKRKREIAVVIAAVVLTAVIFVVEYQLARTSTHVPLAGHILLFALTYLIVLLLILVIFFLVRNVFKLIFERRQRVLGSNLKTRLTIAFVALTLVPTVVLFIASVGVVNTSIEFWFRSQVDESIRAALIVAQAFSNNASGRVRQISTRLADILVSSSLIKEPDEKRTRDFLESRRVAQGLGSVQLYFKNSSKEVVVTEPQLKDLPLPAPRRSFLKIAFQGESTAKILPLDNGADLARGIAPVRLTPNGDPVAAVVVDYYIPKALARRLLPISEAFKDYQESKRMKGPVKLIYIMVLLLISLLVIFVGFWFGMTMARDITDPIQDLAEGTGRIAAGDLDVYIEPVGDDELGLLVRSFNEMSTDLRAGRDELMRVNLDLDNRRKHMETVLRNVAAGVLALDPAGRITAVNRSAVRLLGMEREDLLGRAVLGVLPEASSSAVEEIMEDLEKSGQDAIVKQITISFPDKSLSILCFANSLKEQAGGDLGAVLVFEDMTHLVKAQRIAAWREVARRIAHEIKNPLTPIQLNAQRVRRKYLDQLGEEGTVLDQCTRSIIDQVEQLKNMVNEFSKFARMPSANPVPNDINALIGEVVDLYVQTNDMISFTFSPDSNVPVFDLDREQMKRAIVNLLDNAVAAVGASGEVSVATHYNPELSMVTVEISDNGTGVAPADSDRLFEPYFSKKQGGTGLGLTIVSTIVSDHQGFVRFKNNEHGGTKFTIELPIEKGGRRTPTIPGART